MNELTDRQREILIAIAKGFTGQEIAEDLHLSRRTVEAHRVAIYRKLHVRNAVGVVHFAIANGLVRVGEVAE